MHMLFAFACLLAVFTTASAQAGIGATTITGIAVNTTDGAALHIGSVLAITVTFSTPVYVNATTNDDIQLVLNTDDNAFYSSGSGTNQLVFLLTVTIDDNVDQIQFIDGLSATNPFNFVGSANITDASGALTQASSDSFDPTAVDATDVFTNFAISVDSVVPTLVSVAFVTGNYTLNSVIPLYVKFSEPVALNAPATIQFLGLNFVSTGINSTDDTVINFQATVTSSVGTPNLAALNPTLLLTLGAGVSLTPANAITDLAGNALVNTGTAFTNALSEAVVNGIIAVRTTGTFVINSAEGITAIIGIYSDSQNVTLILGSTINIYVQFDRSVTLTLPSLSAATGVTLTLNNGGVATLATSLLVTATPTLRFTYTVRATDQSRIAPNYLDVSGANALSLGSLAGITLFDGISAGNINLATPSGTSGAQPAGQNTTLGRNNIQVNPSASAGNVIISITSPNATGTDDVYSEGDDLWINVTFSATVIVSGTPTLTLNNGRSATYNSGYSTSRSLIFVYTVTSDDSSDDQIAIANRNAIRLNSGSINDVATGTAANTTIPSGISLNLGYYADGSSSDNNDDVIARIIVEFYDVNSCGSQALQDDEDAIAQIIQDNFNFDFNAYKETSCNGVNKRQDYASDVTLEFDITDFNGNEGDFIDNQDDVRNAINNIDGVQLISLDFSASPVMMPTLFGIALLFLSLLMRN